MSITPIKRALISVSDKTGIVEFARELVNLQVELISTGGTSELLKSAGIPHQSVESITHLPEMLDGRVKTLHPAIAGGILGKRDTHSLEAAHHQIKWIDLVVVNFYPFAQALQKEPSLNLDELVEYIDIGGPTMVRAAAKNHAWVGVVVNPNQYNDVLAEIRQELGLSAKTRRHLAGCAFALTAQYEATIAATFSQAQAYPDSLQLHLHKSAELRYGENPHQQAFAYTTQGNGLLKAKLHQGKALSFNNLLDAEAAWNCVHEFKEPACVIVKHANPCGAAIGQSIEEAYAKAYAADKTSAFGGIVALNRPCTKLLAEMLSQIFFEVILATDFTDEALQVLAKKPNLRVLATPHAFNQTTDMKFISGGVLVQERDQQTVAVDDLKIVTEMQPNAEDINASLFAWRVLKHVKSNGILITNAEQTLGIGAGQVSRIDAVEQAIRKAGSAFSNAVLASDAFFPFRDSIDRIAQTGIRLIIQPGGSMRDDEVIAACNEHHIAMVFTGTRCFKH